MSGYSRLAMCAQEPQELAFFDSGTPRAIVHKVLERARGCWACMTAVRTCGACGGEQVYINNSAVYHTTHTSTQRVTVRRVLVANRGGSQGGALEVSRTPVACWKVVVTCAA
jgi:hypothetical protein